MVKKNRKGKNKTRTHSKDGEVIRVRLPKEDEILGQVIQLLGGGLLLSRCIDGKMRQIRIPGKYRKRMWTRTGDIIILLPQYGLNPDKKGELKHRYRKNENQFLFERGLIPEDYLTL